MLTKVILRAPSVRKWHGSKIPEDSDEEDYDDDSSGEESDGDYKPHGAGDSIQPRIGRTVSAMPRQAFASGVDLPSRRRGRTTEVLRWSDEEEFVSPNVPDFTASPGVKARISPNASPIYYFHLFLDESIFQQMVVETNIYAEQVIGARNKEF